MANGWLEIRQIPNDAQLMRRSVTEAEWAAAAAMSPVSRRTEWLAWRAVVRERLGMEVSISYDGYGAPVLPKGRGHLGVSHTKGWIAVAWSVDKCAVDIEVASRDVSPICARFISDRELLLPGATDALFPICVWCAKEATYKYVRIPGLDFREDLRVVSYDKAQNMMQVSVRGEKPLNIGLIFHSDIVAAIIE